MIDTVYVLYDYIEYYFEFWIYTIVLLYMQLHMSMCTREWSPFCNSSCSAKIACQAAWPERRANRPSKTAPRAAHVTDTTSVFVFLGPELCGRAVFNYEKQRLITKGNG